jgi:Amt family ammonium transporter
VLWNWIGALSIIAWVVVTMSPVFLSMRWLKVLRVSDEIETKGLDMAKHGEPAYPLVAYGHGWNENSRTPQEQGVLPRLSAAHGVCI